MTPKVDLREFVSGFLAEAAELLSLATASLLAVEQAGRQGAANPRAVRDAYRALHTIKGLSAMVGVEPVVALAHRMEASLRTADQAGGKLAPDSVDALLQGLRAIELRVKALAEHAPVPEAPRALLEVLEALEAPGEVGVSALAELDLEPALAEKLAPADREQLAQGIAAGKRALRAQFTPSAERAAAGITITTVREQLGKRAELVKVLPLAVPVSGETPGGLAFVLLLLSDAPGDELEKEFAPAGLAVRSLAALRAAPAAGVEIADDAGAGPSGLVRVEVSRLDDAMERLSALIVTRSRLGRAVAEMAATGADVRQLNQIVSENARQLRDLRAAVLQVRMVRVAEMLERVPLLVRGLRRNSGKLVRLEIDAGRAEVDKAVAERLFPAIVHLVRNAVDHGIESPAERRERGKPEEALLRLRCADRSNNQLELTLSDDGRGIDAEAVARKAGAPVPQTSAALLDLLCAPGFSTRDEATSLSGRGMGMDIVRRIAVDELGGELFLETAPGEGTTFALRVPLTLTIIDAFVFEAGEQRYAVPVSMIEEIFELDPAGVIRTPSGHARAALVQRRGEALPVLSLAALLGDGAHHQVEGKALLIRRGGEPLGFAVRRMVGQQEVVIRPLEDRLVRVPGVSGATDLGDGRPTLVLDLAALASRAQEGKAA